MALVVLLRGVNIGGHRTFRPSVLAAQLKHLDAVSIGAAGTFVVRRPGTRAQLRAELASRLPFDTEVIICAGREISRLMSRDYFGSQPVRGDVNRFVSVLSRRPRAAPLTPITLPAGGRWLVRILGRDDRFVFGVYRRDMKVIGHLGTLDRLFGVPVTSRSWNTICAIAKLLPTGGAYHMKKSAVTKIESPARLIDARIKELDDWRGKTLVRVRALIKQAVPEVVEEWKWRGVPVWYHGGQLCTGETYKSAVKLTFLKGASLKDPAGLFNSSLEGNARRAIDLHEGDKLNEAAFKALIRAAAALNTSSRA